MGTLRISASKLLKFATIPRCIGFVIATLLSTVLGNRAMTVVQGEITQRDLGRPTYRVNIPLEGSTTDFVRDSPLPEGYSSVRMVSAKGQKLQCLVPPAPSPLSLPSSHMLGPDAYDDIDRILKRYEGQCFLRKEGWWSFEFCYDMRVVQFHEAKSEGEKEDRYVLGVLDRGFDRARRFEATNVPRDDAAYTQLYGNGTICDVTGKPREILVKYVCADDVTQMTGIAKELGEVYLVMAIREVATCVYELEFVSSAICKQKLYASNKRKSALDINCNVEAGEGPFRGLTPGFHRKGKSSLTL